MSLKAVAESLSFTSLFPLQHRKELHAMKPLSRVRCNIRQIIEVNEPSTIANRHSAPPSDRGRTPCCNHLAMDCIQPT